MTDLAFIDAFDGVIAAQLALKMFDEVGIVAAILLAIAGMVLNWQAPRHRMTLEERVKDGKLTEDEARRQVRFYAWCAPTATTLGVIVMLLLLFDLAG